MTLRGGESLTPTDGTEINARISFFKTRVSAGADRYARPHRPARCFKK